MVAVSGVLIFAGYQLIAYGWSQVRGSNAGFFDILWPGRFKGSNPDSSSTKDTGSTSNGVTTSPGESASEKNSLNSFGNYLNSGPVKGGG